MSHSYICVRGSVVTGAAVEGFHEEVVAEWSAAGHAVERVPTEQAKRELFTDRATGEIAAEFRPAQASLL